MKKTLFISFSFLILCSAVPKIANNVFICQGTSAKRYHLKKTCRGLSACKSSIKQVTLAKAKSLSRTLCKWED